MAGPLEFGPEMYLPLEDEKPATGFEPLPGEPAKEDKGISGFEARVREYKPQAHEEVYTSPVKGRIPSWEAVPIIGPLAHTASSYGSAALGYGKGESISERAKDIMAYDEARRRAQQEIYPYSAITGNVAGGLAASAVTPATAAGPLVQSALTKTGQYLGSKFGSLFPKAGEAVSGAVTKTVAPMAGKMAEGTIQGGLSSLAERKPDETIGETAERTGTGMAFGAAAPVVVGGLFKGLGKVSDVAEGIISPKTAVAREIAEGAGPQRIAQYLQSLSRNEPVHIADIDEAKNLLNAAVARFGDQDQRVIAINNALKRRLENQSIYVDKQIDNAFGTRIDPSEIRAQSDFLARSQNGPAYNAAYSQPQAQSIWNNDIAKFINTNEGRMAVERADNMARHEAYVRGTVPPRNPFVADQNGNISLGPNNTGASLEFLDYVKRAMNGIAGDIRSGKIASSNSRADARMVEESTRKFTQDLRNIVPEYGTALDGAGKYIRGNNAFEAAESFMNDLVGNKSVSAQLNKFTSGSFSPREQDSFRKGIGTWIKENPEEASRIFAGNTRDTAKVQGILKGLLGPQAYNTIDAGMAVGRLSEMTNAIRANPSLLKKLNIGPTSTAGVVGGAAGLGIAGQEIVQKMISYASQSPKALAAAGIAGAVGATNRLATGRKLGALLDLAAQDTPESRKILLDAAMNSSSYRQALRTLEGLMTKSLALQQEQYPSDMSPVGPAKYEERRFPRATGGRVKNHQTEADRLIRLAESHKKRINQQTEQILETPDDHVAQALEVANRHI